MWRAEVVSRSFAFAFALAFAFAAPAWGSEPEIAGMGARSSALAASGAADAVGYDAAYANPAGVVEGGARRLTLGYVFGRGRIRLDGAARHIEDTQGLVLGAAVPLPLGGVLKNRLALGLAFYLPAGLLNRASAPFPDEARLALVEQRTQVVTLTASLSARLHERVTFGIGVTALAALIGEIRIRPDASGAITTVSEEQLVVDYAAVMGLRVRAHRLLSLGVVYRGESKSAYDLRITNQLGALLPLEIPTLRIAGVAQFDPHQIALEGAFRAHRLALLIAGLTWKHWSSFPLPTENATAGAPSQPRTGYHDTVVPRLALELGGHLGPIELFGRAGYFFEWSPAPRDALTLIDADRHVVTAGLGLRWNHRYGALLVDVFAQWHQLAGSSRASGGLAFTGITVGVDL